MRVELLERPRAGWRPQGRSDDRMHRIECRFRRFRVSFPPVSVKAGGGGRGEFPFTSLSACGHDGFMSAPLNRRSILGSVPVLAGLAALAACSKDSGSSASPSPTPSADVENYQDRKSVV